ncbi:hypothetical protein PCE1_003941 [Barthelona sp. PCE]
MPKQVELQDIAEYPALETEHSNKWSFCERFLFFIVVLIVSAASVGVINWVEPDDQVFWKVVSVVSISCVLLWCFLFVFVKCWKWRFWLMSALAYPIVYTVCYELDFNGKEYPVYITGGFIIGYFFLSMKSLNAASNILLFAIFTTIGVVLAANMHENGDIWGFNNWSFTLLSSCLIFVALVIPHIFSRLNCGRRFAIGLLIMTIPLAMLLFHLLHQEYLWVAIMVCSIHLGVSLILFYIAIACCSGWREVKKTDEEHPLRESASSGGKTYVLVPPTRPVVPLTIVQQSLQEEKKDVNKRNSV